EDVGRATLVGPVDVAASQHGRGADGAFETMLPHFVAVAGTPTEQNSFIGQSIHVAPLGQHRLLVALLRVSPNDLPTAVGADGDRLALRIAAADNHDVTVPDRGSARGRGRPGSRPELLAGV